MNKIVIIALVMLVACKRHADKPDQQIPKLPVPTKLPPAATGSAQAGGNDHAAEIDNEYATLMAMYKAPPGATPCDTLYNAIGAERDKAKELKRDSVFSFVAAKDDFMKLCGALPAITQQCLAPAYQAHHAQECEGVDPADPKLEKLFTLRKDLEPPKESGQMGSN